MADKTLTSKRNMLVLAMVFLASAAYTMPAKLLVSASGLSSAGVYLQGTSGYWHSGNATLLQVNLPDYAIALQDLDWNIKLGYLLLGRISVDLSASFAGRDVTATVSQSVFGRRAVSGLSALVSADDVRPLLKNLIVPVDGWLELRDVSLAHDGEWFTAVDGLARVTQLSAQVPLGELTIGNFDLELFLADPPTKDVVAILENYSGQFGLTGEVGLKANSEYLIALASKPDGTVEPMLLQQMRMLFGPPTEGQYHFEYSDKF